MDGPVLIRPIRIAQAGKRYLHLHHPPVVVHLPLRLPDRVEALVLAAVGLPDGVAVAFLGPVGVPQHVALNAVGIAEEFVRPLPVLVGVDDDPHEIVPVDLVPVGQRRSQFPDLGVVADKGDEQIALAVGDVPLGRHPGGDLVHRHEFGEVVKTGGPQPGLFDDPVDAYIRRSRFDLENRVFIQRLLDPGGASQTERT